MLRVLSVAQSFLLINILGIFMAPSVKKSNRSLSIIIMIVMIIIIIVLLPSDRLCNPNFLIHLYHLSGVSISCKSF